VGEAGGWAAFGSDLAATVIGVLIGVPFALWLNRLNVTHAEKVRAAAERARIVEGLASLGRSLDGNLRRLQAVVQERARDQMFFPLVLDVSTWEAVGVQLVGSLNDPDLLSRLAHHYDRLEQLRRLNEHIFEVTVGVASALATAETVRKALAEEYTTEARELTADCAGLIDKVSIASQRLLPNTE
jgi:hypothetical protein